MTLATMLPLDDVPAALAREVGRQLDAFTDQCPEHRLWLEQRLTDTAFAAQLLRCWGGSPFAADLCLRHPDWLQALDAEGLLVQASTADDLSQRLRTFCRTDSPESLWADLRRFRNREMLRLIWRDLNRLAAMEDTTAEVSALADASIELALDFHYRELCAELGTPTALVGGQALAQRMVVLGMGKLGAGELNLSSDIDLIFAYPQTGETVGGAPRPGGPLHNQEFFLRLARRLIHALDNQTADGFVFRVDMRLRPWGESGPLVADFDAMEDYYQVQGRDWERYAMIKARVVAGDSESGEALLNLLRPFVYRRYIDFSAIEALRDMKGMIEQEVKRRRLHTNVKLGAGGIREVEFIAQAFQLIRGGKLPRLQRRELVPVLLVLADKGLLPRAAVDELIDAYRFLRNTEHAIQAYADRQTQTLPDAELPRAALAFAMGFADWASFSAALSRHREIVRGHFQQLIEPPAAAPGTAPAPRWEQLWQQAMGEEQAHAFLRELGYDDVTAVWSCLQALRSSPAVERMQPIGRQRLDQLMPLLLRSVLKHEQPAQTLQRIVPLVEAVLRRTAYLVLLVENPRALDQLIILCGASPWISSQLARHPVLLDELLDERTLYAAPARDLLQDELQQQLLRIPMDDLEAQMAGLRYFKLAQVLRVAALEVTDRLPLMKVSDYLTFIAEVILEHVLELAWQDLVRKHGYPQKAAGVACDKEFIVVGYGKLGGLELGHGSDLDLVFIHGADPGLTTDGERAVDNGVFFTRLGQRMIHILTAQTLQGQLYDVDMRLRPSGASGLLVTSLEAFAEYQQQNAWTWEHQALVRARVVAGDTALARRFDAVRAEVLQRPRGLDDLRREVAEMRHKMRQQLLPKGLEEGEAPLFHLKHGSGGIVDIEFMVQYAVLAWSQQHPALTVYPDNIRILEALQRTGLFSEAQVQSLIDAYKVFRAESHRLSLQQQPGQVPVDGFAEHRRAVIAKWQELFGA